MNSTTAESRELLDQEQSPAGNKAGHLAFTDWIDSTRETHPDLAQRLDRANSHFSELLSTRATMSEIEQQRDGAIASIRDYMQEHPELSDSLTQLAEEYAGAEWNQQEGEMVRLIYQGVMVDDIVDKTKEIIELDKSLGYVGETSYQKLGVMETGEDSFFISIEFSETYSEDLFEYQNGVVTKNEMSPQDMAKLKQLHTNAIAWEENFDNWKAEREAEFDAREAQHNGDVQFQSTGQLDVEAIAGNTQTAGPTSSLTTDRPLSEKEYMVVQAVLDAYALDNPQEFAQIMSGEDMSVNEAETLFQDFGLDAHEYGDEAELDDEDELED